MGKNYLGRSVYLTVTSRIESMGLPNFWIWRRTRDIWEPEEDIYWGTEGEMAGE